MTIELGPLDEVLGELLETCDNRYAFEFDREKRVINFIRGEMIARAVECDGGLVIVSYNWGHQELEHEFCTPPQAAALIDAAMTRKEPTQLPKHGKPPMLVMEFAKDSAQALALEFYPENAEAFSQKLPAVKAALLEWKAKHESRCEMVMFTVVGAAEHHFAIESLIRQAFNEDFKLASLLDSLEVRITFLVDPRGEPVNEFALAPSSSPVAAKAKPWWRLW